MQRFADKVAIVTGAGSGIGAAIAHRLVQEGAKVILAGRTQSKLLEAAQAIGGDPDKIICQPTDVSVQSDVEALIDRAISAFGQLDVLVNNAGMGHLGRITDVPPETWRTLFATDVDSIFFACRAAMPHLQKTSGAIVNIASISGIGGDYGMSVYNAAKGAVINFTKGMALDHASAGVRVNSVSPGMIKTPAVAALLARAQELWDERIPLGRPGEAEEIAAATAFLASSDASYITGHNLVVDGGLTSHTGQPNLLRLFGR